MSAIVNIVLDVIIIALPLRKISKLRMSWDKKAMIMIMFSLGIL